MIADSTRHPPVTNPYDAINFVAGQDWLYTLNYASAALIMVLAALLFAALYSMFKDAAPAAMLAGLVFVPVYTAMNLFVYLSQITVVPGMVMLRSALSTNPNQLDMLIALLVQLWPGSITAMLNVLAYAVLGIPSLLFGLEMLRRGPLLRAAGILLWASNPPSASLPSGRNLCTYNVGHRCILSSKVRISTSSSLNRWKW